MISPIHATHLKSISVAWAHEEAASRESYTRACALDDELRAAQVAALTEVFNAAFVFDEGMEAGAALGADGRGGDIVASCRWDRRAMHWSASIRLALDEPNFESVLTWRRSGDCPATVVQAVIAEFCDFAWSTQRADLAPRIESLNATIWKAT
jgi:hypothetical protein